VFAHLAMMLGSDGKPLSERHGAVSVLQYRDDGYLPQALLNYLRGSAGRTATKSSFR